MKKSFYYLTLCLLLIAGSVNASFPVDKEDKQAKTEVVATDDTQVPMETIETLSDAQNEMDEAEGEEDWWKRMSDEDFWITLALWFFLGGFAAHRWYRGRPVGWNILFILTAGGCGIWAIVDLVKILRRDF